MKDLDRILEDLRQAAQAEFEDRKRHEVRIAKSANADTVEACQAALASDEVALRRTAVEILKRVCSEFPQASESLLQQLLSDPDAKTRRRIAAGLGETGDSSLIPSLTNALNSEEHRFVQASIILALGKLGCSDWPAPFDTWDQNHGPIFDALKKAGAQILERPTEEIARGVGHYVLSLYSGLEGALADELHARGLSAGAAIPPVFLGTSASTDEEVKALGEVRSAVLDFRSANSTSSSIDGCFEPAVAEIKSALGEAAENLAFRLTLPTESSKSKYTKSVQQAVARIEEISGGWRNAPAAYSLDIRVIRVANEYEVIWRSSQWPTPQNRERKSIPASIHPSVAAGLCVIAGRKQLLTKRALTICDPACGAGTILIEARAMFPNAKLIGSDWSADAVAVARENLESAGVKAELSRRDFRQLGIPPKSVDIVISNLPFGIRVKIQNIEGLYAQFLAAARKILKPDGVLVIYTANQKSIHAAFKGGMGPRSLTRVDASGLSVFVTRIEAAELKALRKLP
ncbi:MAG: putative RNA methylase [Verrucomicrobiales bacterium]